MLSSALCQSRRICALQHQACRSAHLAVDFAFEAPEATAAWGTEALLRACAAHGVRAIVQCSDALVGYDGAADICDGDELSDPGEIQLSAVQPRGGGS